MSAASLHRRLRCLLAAVASPAAGTARGAATGAAQPPWSVGGPATYASASSAAARAYDGTIGEAGGDRARPRSVDDPFGAVPQPPCHRVVVTGIGLVTPLGVGAATTWSNLVDGACGIRQLEPGDLPAAHRAVLASLPSRIAGLVPRQQLAEALERLKEDPRRNSPFMLYALVAAAEALEDARWRPATAEQRAYTGVALGNGMSCTAEVGEAGQMLAEGKLRRLSPLFVPRILVNMAAGAVGIRYGLNGPNHAVSTACATGAHAVGDAFRMVQRGDAKVMLAGASEACVDAISIGGFGRLKALSTTWNGDPTAASRPFDASRDGFVMGEGAGVLVLEEMGHARARGARAYAEVRGYGMSGDGYHITRPHPQGLGAQLSMRRALAGSGVAPGDVAYVNAHATSTPAGDEIELAAIRDVFGPDACDGGLLVSSTKGATGHLLGAAGAVEAAFAVLALRHGVAPPTLNLEVPAADVPAAADADVSAASRDASEANPHGSGDMDPGVLQDGGGRTGAGSGGRAGGTGSGPLPGLLALAKKSAPLRPGPKAALSNSFGFGGTNASVLFCTPPDC